jgi:hypothetical protein
MKRVSYIILVIVGLFFNGCKTQEILTDTTQSDQKKLIEEDARLVKSKIVDNNTVDTTIILKNFKINYKSPKRSATLYGAAKIIRDSAILVSLRAPLGIELSRVLLKPDAVLMLDRKENQYLIGDYTYFQDRFKLNLDFNLIHSLLLANFPKGYELLTKEGSVVQQSEYSSDSLYVGNYYKPAGNHYKFSLWLHPKLFKPKNIIFYRKRNIKDFNITYDNFTQYTNFYLPDRINIKDGSSRKKYNIQLSYRTIELSAETDVQFQVPSTYQKVYIK